MPIRIDNIEQIRNALNSEVLKNRVDLLEKRIDELLNLMSSPLMIKPVQWSSTVESFTRPAENFGEQELSPLITRFYRAYDDDGLESPKGGITFVFRINYSKGTVKVGVAICSDKENFNKKTGRDLAVNRFDKEPMTTVYAEGGPLVTVFLKHVESDSVMYGPRGENPVFNKLKTLIDNGLF